MILDHNYWARMQLTKNAIEIITSVIEVAEKLSMVAMMKTYKNTFPKPKLRNMNHYTTDDFSSSEQPRLTSPEASILKRLYADKYL